MDYLAHRALTLGAKNICPISMKVIKPHHKTELKKYGIVTVRVIKNATRP